jgi:hypothetical protein
LKGVHIALPAFTLGGVGAEKSQIHVDYHDKSIHTSINNATNSMGVAFPKLDFDPWAVTFLAGVQNGIPKWEGCQAILDTGCDETFIRQDIVERAGLKDEIKPFQGEIRVLVDQSNEEHPLDQIVELTWYRNKEPTSTKLEFFVLPTGPFEMVFGLGFTVEYLRNLYGDEFVKDIKRRRSEKGSVMGLKTRVLSKGR